MQIIRKCITDLKIMYAADLFDNGKSGHLESGVSTPFRNRQQKKVQILMHWVTGYIYLH